jgi:hypothetical protein
MKVGSDANYNVRVRRREWEEPTEQEPLYEGIYTFEVNQAVQVSFVPRVTAGGPPWSSAGLPDDMADFTTAEQARLLEVLTGMYAVTPDDARAGTEEQLPWLFPWPDSEDTLARPGDPPPSPTVFFVSTAEFGRLVADLEVLTDIAGRVQSMIRRAAVADHEAVQFIDQRVLRSPLMKRYDAAAAGLPV